MAFTFLQQLTRLIFNIPVRPIAAQKLPSGVGRFKKRLKKIAKTAFQYSNHLAKVGSKAKNLPVMNLSRYTIQTQNVVKNPKSQFGNFVFLLVASLAFVANLSGKSLDLFNGDLYPGIAGYSNAVASELR